MAGEVDSEVGGSGDEMTGEVGAEVTTGGADVTTGEAVVTATLINSLVTSEGVSVTAGCG